MSRRDFILTCVLALLLGYFVRSAFAAETFLVKVQEQNVIDYRGIRHFDLITPQDGTRLSIMGDADLPLIREMGNHNGQRVRIVIERFDAPRLER